MPTPTPEVIELRQELAADLAKMTEDQLIDFLGRLGAAIMLELRLRSEGQN